MTKQEDYVKKLYSILSFFFDRLEEIDDKELNITVKNKRNFNTWFKKHFGIKLPSTELDIVFSEAYNEINKDQEPLTGLFVSIYLGYLMSKIDYYKSPEGGESLLASYN